MVIAAITSCTNTSNPSVMLAAGLLAKKAVERGLKVKPWVKTSLAPGSKVVMDYYNEAGLMPYLEALNFHLVGFGCTTCIGNSGPLPDAVAEAVTKENLVVAAVLSGNRNFEGRINPLVKANYLASPPLVVAYAHRGHDGYRPGDGAAGAGSRGRGRCTCATSGRPTKKCRTRCSASIDQSMFQREYAQAFEGDENWRTMPVPTGSTFQWDEKSTYIKKPPYFDADGGSGDVDSGSGGDAGAGDAGRFGDDGSHFAGGVDRGGQSGGQVSDRAGRGAEGLQLVRRAARQPRGDGARHAREHPAEEPAGAGDRRRLDDAPAERREDVHLRRRRCSTRARACR